MKIISFIVVIFLMPNLLSAQYKISESIFSEGDARISSTDFQINSIIGQTLIGLSGGGNYQLLTDVNNKNDNGQLPDNYKLYDNYPNPFNPTTIIKYNLPSAKHVTLQVYNILGQLISTLVDKTQAAGSYSVSFNALNLNSGMYIYRLKAGNYIKTKKMILIK